LRYCCKQTCNDRNGRFRTHTSACPRSSGSIWTCSRIFAAHMGCQLDLARIDDCHTKFHEPFRFGRSWISKWYL